MLCSFLCVFMLCVKHMHYVPLTLMCMLNKYSQCKLFFPLLDFKNSSEPQFKSSRLTVSSCRLFFFFFFFLPQQLESTSLLGDSLPSKPSSSCPPISRDGGISSSRRYDRFLRVQIQFSTIWGQAGEETESERERVCSYSSGSLNHHDKSYNALNSAQHTTVSTANVWYKALLFAALQIN